MASFHMRMHDSRCLAWRTSHRSHFEIMATMIEAMKGGASLYSVMKHTGTNPRAIKRYLDSTTEMGLIETGVDEGRVFYKPTEKGLDYLNQYYILLEVLLGKRATKALGIR